MNDVLAHSSKDSLSFMDEFAHFKKTHTDRIKARSRGREDEKKSENVEGGLRHGEMEPHTYPSADPTKLCCFICTTPLLWHLEVAEWWCLKCKIWLRFSSKESRILERTMWDAGVVEE